jgi:two-component system sensor histidine kinase DctS
MLLPVSAQVRRWVLWSLLVVLVLLMLTTLVWLAGRYEVSQVQSRIERDAADAVTDIRTALTRNVQSLQALQYADRSTVPWTHDASVLLREHREWLRLELRDLDLRVVKSIDTPFRAPVFNRFGRAMARVPMYRKPMVWASKSWMCVCPSSPMDSSQAIPWPPIRSTRFW